MRSAILLFVTAAAAIAGGGSGPLRVGASRVEFTKMIPAPEIAPLGYEHEKLFIRAIVLDNGATRAALLTVDGNSPGSIPGRVAAALEIPVENVISSSTHSHSAFFGGPPPGSPGFRQQEAASSPLDDLAVEAVREARARLQPARMSFGSGLSYLNVNRDAISPTTRLWTQDANPAGPSDKTVAVLKFESQSGELIAIYSNYAMHPVNLYLGGITSADFPGAACRYIEQIYGDRVVAMFSQGAEGDQNPLYLRASAAHMLRRGGQEYHGQPLVREPTEKLIRDGERKMVPVDAKGADQIEKFIEAEGIIFAEEVLRVAQSLPPGQSEIRISGAQKTVTCPGRTRTDQGREGKPGSYTDGPDVNWLVRTVGIGNVGLVGVNAELYTAIGQELKAKSPMANTVVVGLANGFSNSGYVPTDDAYGHNTFQVLGARTKPGCAEGALVAAGEELLTGYARSGM